jgi:hypothetical protein
MVRKLFGMNDDEFAENLAGLRLAGTMFGKPARQVVGNSNIPFSCLAAEHVYRNHEHKS